MTLARPSSLSSIPARAAPMRQETRAERPEYVLAYDIETVPDPDLPTEVTETFPKPIRHRIACLSFVLARIVRDGAGRERFDVEEIRSGGEADWDERRLLRGFWALLAAKPCRLVGWNSRRFDMPVLHARSLLHGVDAGIYWRRGDRWSGYGARYSGEWACDVMDALGSCGAAPAHGLDEVCVALGLPGKMGESGSNVAELVERGEIERVRRYCETDVANTIGVYARYALLTGRMDAEGYRRTVEGMRAVLTADPERAPHLVEFERRWGSCAIRS